MMMTLLGAHVLSYLLLPKRNHANILWDTNMAKEMRFSKAHFFAVNAEELS